MTKALLEQIEKQLAAMDPEAMSFDHEEAEQCKAALVRIAEKAATLCHKITARPERGSKSPRFTASDQAARMAAHEARVSRPRRVITVGEGNSND